MKLNIYEKKQVVKTYEANSYDLMFGTVEDVANAINLDELKSGTDAEIMTMVIKLISSSMGTIKQLMMDIFDGLTADELKKVKVSEMAHVIVEVVTFTIQQLNMGAGSKN